ncbi:hypothetical protein LC613_41550 [Nostoc sphaeroides CHAB 2801]|uniref:Uncharacterized protein n=1 Tax=Nostoc sphaeroides CCNUC1 TaxID=2653204 RepID=A0A5P8WAP5_9NOSO|nr:hypothetical protein [Nostoc sphaeroides]MCC5633903.1 hypothetical protein [Nostoc sphaeroides CHAB 2801]QFS49867.1 hypothetical protein GXM_07361 [Nostoc sphaeroides CCNUC1]QFS52481.1 hypothetical protein GXM_09975 [Nostoc sphaeroides CCNUC1]
MLRCTKRKSVNSQQLSVISQKREQCSNSEVLKIPVLNHIFRGAASTPAVRHRSQITVFIENLGL